MLINEDNKTELIDAYLDGRLNKDELREFEDKLKIDSDLRGEIQAQRAVRRYIVQKGRVELKNKLKQFHQEMLGADQNLEKDTKEVFLTPQSKEKGELIKNKPVIFSTNRRVNFAIAAAIIVLIVSIFAIINPTQPPHSDGLLAGGKVFQIELKQLNQQSAGIAGNEIPISDSLTLIIKESDQYTFHYQFTKELTIYAQYLDPNLSKVFVEHDSEKNIYTLVVDGKRYLLERGFIDINPLKEENPK
jgi:hypothetical protein